MKKWQKRFIAIAASLGLTSKLKDGELTAKEQHSIISAYEKEYGTSFTADREANEDIPETQAVLSTEEISSLASVLGVEESSVSPDAVKTSKMAASIASDAKKEVKRLKEENDVLAQQPDNAVHRIDGHISVKVDNNRVLGLAPSTGSYLFGIESPMFARDKWYNKVMETRAPNERLSSADREAFKVDFIQFGEDLKQRAAHLSSSGLSSTLDYREMLKGEGSIDYSDLLDKAGEYVVRRTDIILAFFRTLPSVSDIFPVVSNVQNKEIAPNANFGELSQGYRKGRNFKGDIAFSAEIYSVVDVMFKFLFDDLISLEKQYIGYLNREGSNVIKWTFIEWILVHFGSILLSEQNRRRVMGVRTPQQDVASNPAMLAADGVLRAIERVEEELKVLPFEDYGVYSSATMVDVVESFWDKVVEILPSVDGYKIYINAKHKQWYIRGYRSKYGENSDFTGASLAPMSDMASNIAWVPNMPINCYKMWITLPGNVETYEDKPGEMFGFDFIRELEGIATISRWKEGAGLLAAGIKYNTPSELEESLRENQWIFTNYPATAISLAGTIDVSGNTLFTITGTTAVAIVNGISSERVYKFVAGESGAKISKSGPFSKISSDFTAVAKGDYLKVYAELEDYDVTRDGVTFKATRSTGKFLELARKVNN